MANGQKFVTQGTSTGSHQKLYDSLLLAGGSLVLVDPQHSLGAFTGTWDDGATLPNVAAPLLVKRLGSGLASNYQLVMRTARENANTWKMERTTKGGIHFVSSQTAQTAQGNNGWINGSGSLRTALLNEMPTTPAGALAISIWYLPTRAAAGGAPNQSISHLASSVSPTSNKLWVAEGFTLSPGSASLGSAVRSHTIGAPSRIACCTSAWAGSKPAAGSFVTNLFANGPVDAWSAAGSINKRESVILYMLRVENLLYNKRANAGAGGTLAEEYAAFLADDAAKFAEAFGTGGRWNGDSWTDPSGY